MASMTCLACNVGFEDMELGRLHYKTDWHRYNLKRKVANLVPVTLEKFQERISLQEKQEQESASSQESSVCKPCNKVFNTANAYENHIQSKKHKDVISGKEKRPNKSKRGKQKASSANKQIPEKEKESEQNVEEPMSDEDIETDSDSYDENSIDVEECLFCGFVSSNLEDNVQHMSSHHGFFLPDAEFINDLDGLITYLGEKVGAGKICLWCDQKGKKFFNTRDVQRHMVDKGHCKLLHEGDVIFEYADFYDYTSSYPDAEDSDKNPEEVVNLEELDTDGFSLTLPSGAIIGHRSLMNYYQQNLVPYHGEKTKKLLPKMLAHYKALGWTGTSGLQVAGRLQVAQRVTDVKYMQRIRSRMHMQLGIKANKMRHRFRLQNPI